MSSLWPATQRFGISPAPGGLGLVQEFLNTDGIEGYGPDLLSDLTLARDWVTAAVPTWAELRGTTAQPPALDEADLAKLRELRATIAQLLAGRSPAKRSPLATAALTVSDDGEVRLDPTGSGWRWLASALWSEILLGQLAGTWRRVKRCHNDRCGSTFYDRSKNNSGVWHDVRTCGNAANLRASRARRRARAENCAGPTGGSASAGRRGPLDVE